MGLVDDGRPAVWEPAKGGEGRPFLVRAGEVLTFLGLLFRGFFLDPVSGALGVALCEGGWV